ncbi:hypothetical protein DFH09DRAFT_540855 [Mycena vulgaris]|nr:hypothetical protein DFH09DRAFT_540855 [Mycena vulgaris]
MRSTPLQPECFINPLRYHVRMWYRTSFKIADGQYLPMSFLVDTNAPSWLYLSSKALTALNDHGRIDRLDYLLRLQNGIAFYIANTPRSHRPLNLIGIELIQKFELCVKPGSWRWMNGIDYW